MPAASRLRFHPLLIDALVVISVGLVGLGLATTDVLMPTGWSAATIRSLGIIAGASVGATILAIRLQTHTGLNQNVFIAVGLLVLAAAVFGTAAIVVVAILLVSSVACGTALLEFGHPQTTITPVAVRLSLGLAIATIALTMLSPFRVNFPLVHVLLLMVLALPLLRPGIRARLKDDAIALSRPSAETGALMLVWRILAILLLVFVMLHAALPERYHDALAVHLYVASYVAAHGEWAYDPRLFVFAVIPLAADFLYAHVYLFAGEPAVKLLNYATFLTIVALVGGSVSRRFGKQAGIVAALLYASMPLTLVETASSFIENPLTMWITAVAVVLLERGRHVTFPELAAVLLLLAAATLTKVHGAIASVMLGSLAVGLYLSIRRRPTELVRLSIVLAAAGSVALSSYAYAYWITGNPVFPFFNNVFKSPFYPPVQFVDTRWIGRFDIDLLYQATFHSDRFLEAYNGALGFSLASFLPAALLFALASSIELGLLSLVFVGFIITIGWSTQYLRYFYPALPISFMAVGMLASRYFSDHRRAPLFTLAVLAVIGLNVYKLNAGGWILANYDFSVLFDHQKARRYEQVFVPEKSLFRIVNQLQGRSARVLLSGVSSAAPLEGTALYTSWYSEDFSKFGAAAKSGADVEAYIRKMKPTYIVHRSPPEPSYPFHALLDVEIGRLGRKVASLGQVSLYEVVVP